jgi:hypothetical protein
MNPRQIADSLATQAELFAALEGFEHDAADLSLTAAAIYSLVRENQLLKDQLVELADAIVQHQKASSRAAQRNDTPGQVMADLALWSVMKKNGT